MNKKKESNSAKTLLDKGKGKAHISDEQARTRSRGAEITDPETNEEVDPICGECGNVMIREEEQWVCPHCQGEIDFFGEDEE